MWSPKLRRSVGSAGVVASGNKLKNGYADTAQELRDSRRLFLRCWTSRAGRIALTGCGWIGCRAVTVPCSARKAAWLDHRWITQCGHRHPSNQSRASRRSLFVTQRVPRVLSADILNVPRLYSHDRNKAGPGNNAATSLVFLGTESSIEVHQTRSRTLCRSNHNATSIA